IEGRLKRPEYVACAVRIYRRLIDRYVEDPSRYFVSDDESLRLAQLFNRGFTEAYLMENPRGELMSRKSPHNRGILIGTVTGYDRGKGRLSVKLSGRLSSGDGIAVRTAGTAGSGMIVRRMYAGGRLTDHADSGTVVEILSGVSAHAGSAVYRTLDRQLMESLRRTFTSPTPIRKVPVAIRAKAAVGFPFELQIEDIDSNGVCVHSEYIIEPAIRDPTTEEQVVRQLTKLGNTVFEVSAIDVAIDGSVFIPVSQLNRVRNEAISMLESIRMKSARRGRVTPVASATGTTDLPAPPSVSTVPSVPTVPTGHEAGVVGNTLLAVSTNTLAGVKSAISGGADVIYLGGERYRGREARSGSGDGVPDLEAAVRYVHRRGCRIYLNTQRIVKDGGMGTVAEVLSGAKALGFDGALASNHGVFRLAREIGLEIIVDMPLNTFNRKSLGFWAEHGAKMVVLSPELTLAEIRRIAPHGAAECIVHGRLTLMESEHCVVGGILGGADSCTAPCEDGGFELVDEKGYAFPLMMDTDCRMHLLNSSELCMLDHIPAIVRAGVSSIRIEARAIEPDRAGAITRLYRTALDGCSARDSKIQSTCKDITREYTTGHYRRGVV
ncbi:MAG: DUF3656 domain-containing protein, partial [Phycisphaerae bacterium]|nr:DUF3656 domain-containing protein [Phycisphaerae bacterium]